MKIKVYKDVGGEWRWKAIARNGRIIADGSEGYKRKGGAQKAAARFLKHASSVEDPSTAIITE